MVYQWKVLCSRIVPWFTVTDNIYKIESANMLTFFFFSPKKKKKSNMVNTIRFTSGNNSNDYP